MEHTVKSTINKSTNQQMKMNPIQQAKMVMKTNYIITKNKTKTELAQYLHATAFSPSISTLQRAIQNGNFVSWPGIHQLNFDKLLKTTIAVEKGHMDQERKNLRTTQIDDITEFFTVKSDKRENELYVKVIASKEIETKEKT